MDSFQGCYRNSPRDCRSFAAVYLMLRIALFIAYSVTWSQFVYQIAAVLTILTVILVAVVKPYKSSVQNTLDVVLLVVLAAGFLSVSANIMAFELNFKFIKASQLMIYMILSVPVVYLFALLVHSLICQRPLVKIIYRRVLTFVTNGRNRAGSLESLPHRIDHAEEYATLEFPSEATYGSTDSTPAV